MGVYVLLLFSSRKCWTPKHKYKSLLLLPTWFGFGQFKCMQALRSAKSGFAVVLEKGEKGKIGKLLSFFQYYCITVYEKMAMESGN